MAADKNRATYLTGQSDRSQFVDALRSPVELGQLNTKVLILFAQCLLLLITLKLSSKVVSHSLGVNQRLPLSPTSSGWETGPTGGFESSGKNTAVETCKQPGAGPTKLRKLVKQTFLPLTKQPMLHTK